MVHMTQERGERNQIIYKQLRNTIVILIVLLMISTALVSYYVNLRSALDNARRSDRMQIQTHSGLMESMKDFAIQIGHQVHADNRVASLLYGTSQPLQDQYMAMMQLNTYRASIPYIDSIYVYNGASDTFAISSTQSGALGVSYEEMTAADPLVGQIISDATIKSLLRPYPHWIRHPETYKKDVYCYTYVVSELYGQEKMQEAVFVNFTTGWLEQIVKEDQSSLSETLLLDQEANILFSTREEHISESLAGSELWRCIQEIREAPDSAIRRVDGAQKLLTVQPAEEDGWCYVRITPYEVVRKNILSALRMQLLVDAALLLVFILISLRISKRLYFPIETISRQLDTIQDEKEALEATNQRKRFMRKLLLDTSVSDQHEGLVQEISKADKDFCGGQYYYVLVLHIDKYNRFCNTYTLQERAARMETLIETGRELLAKHFVVRTLELGEGSNIVFILMTHHDEPPARETWTLVLQEFRKRSQEMLSIKFSCAVSTPGNHIGELSDLYHQAHNALNYRIFPGGDATIFARDIQAYENTAYAYPEDLEDRMITCIMNGDCDTAVRLAKEILSNMDHLPFITIRLTLSRLSSSLLSMMKKAETGSFSFPPELSETLATAASLEEIDSFQTTVQYYTSVIEQLCAYLDSKHDSRHDELVDRINDLIDQNYSDPNCTLAFLAQQVNLSPSYITRLYRSRMLMTVPNHINDVRMEAARKLLREQPNMSITEVSRQVGFSSISYFSKAFRKEHGMAPNEYRNYTGQGE